MTVKDKLILIASGSSDIGKATAIELAKQGAIIILQARGVERLKTAQKDLGS